MQLDIEDILANAFGRIVRQCLLFASAVWIGSMVGGLALVIGIGGHSWHDALMNLNRVWASPLLLGTAWMVPNIIPLLGGLGYFVVSESAGFKAWGVVAALESFFVMAGWAMELKDPISIAIAWGAWLVLLVMLETGVWLIWQMLRNRWARQLALLEMENARRRAELEARQREVIDREKDAD
ncbi:MAG: hypothetical protein V4819_07230 [Verrucomicrobiota bacterium]